MASFDKTLEIIIEHLGKIHTRLESIDDRLSTLETRASEFADDESCPDERISIVENISSENKETLERVVVSTNNIAKHVSMLNDTVQDYQSHSIVKYQESMEFLEENNNLVKRELSQLKAEISEIVAMTMKDIDSNRPLICKPPGVLKRIKRTGV